jgi:uncharacterized membrane protein
MYSSDYRERARQSLSGRWFEPIMVNVILIMISASTGWITEVIPQLSIFSITISGPLYLGVAFYFSQFVVNNDRGISDMFYGFNFLWGKSIVLFFFTGLFTLLWLLCFIVPGIIKAFAYAMAPYILADVPTMSAFDALDESQTMMEGRKWELFKLGFSFIGWFLLSILSFGILLIWIIPYMQTAFAAFYQQNKIKKGTI